MVKNLPDSQKKWSLLNRKQSLPNGIASLTLTVTTLSGRFPYAVISDAHRYSKLEQTSPSTFLRISPPIAIMIGVSRNCLRTNWKLERPEITESEKISVERGRSAPILNMHCASNSMLYTNLSDNVRTVSVTLVPICIVKLYLQWRQC